MNTVFRHFIRTAAIVFRTAAAALCAQALLHAPAMAQPRAGFAAPDPTAFGARIELRDLAQARAWLGAGLDPDYAADRIGTGLMIAAWNGDLAMMELFAAHGADLNRANRAGERALMHAAYRGHFAAVRWLLAKGARANSEPGRWSALHYAAFAGHQEIVQALLASGADVNARNANGATPLMMAVYENQEPIVRQLMDKGADAALKNDRGEGALEWAFKLQRLSISRLVATPREFAAAASLPRSHWAPAIRSQPLPSEPPAAAAAAAQAPPQDDFLTEQIEDLMSTRRLLAARGVNTAVARIDSRIASLRAQRARADAEVSGVMLEIRARRAAPTDQSTRLITAPAR
jgi:uncharacterized protein